MVPSDSKYVNLKQFVHTLKLYRGSFGIASESSISSFVGGARVVGVSDIILEYTSTLENFFAVIEFAQPHDSFIIHCPLLKCMFRSLIDKKSQIGQ